MLTKELEYSASRDQLATRVATSAKAVSIFTGPADAMLLLAEWGFRQVYWRSSWLRQFVKRARSRKRPAKQVASKQEFVNYLRGVGVVPGTLVMVHTSLSGLSLKPDSETNVEPDSPLKVAKDVLSVLTGLVGDSGTLVMPTHPMYKTVPASSSASADPVPVYNPRSTPCWVGLANEFFWRMPGTQRSLHPHNTLAARGPLAAELLRHNLNASKPLAHGIDSGYYRFCERNGLLLSVGVSLASCLSLVHVREESMDEKWPVRDFFEERAYVLRNDGEDRPVTIRKTRPNFMKFSLCNRKLHRDLVNAGVVHEGHVGTIRVDWARAGDVYRFLTERSRSSTYPFFFTSLVPRKAVTDA